MLAKMSLCSAEEDGASLDVEDHDDLHSPTDVSEDSVEVRVTPIAAKRKLGAPPQPPPQLQQADTKRTALPPSPKRRRPSSPLSPFRPWSVPSPTRPLIPTPVAVHVPVPVPAAGAASTSAPQDEPLALVKTRVSTATPTVPVIPRTPRSPRSPRGSRFAAADASRTPPTPTKSCTASKPVAPRFSVESIIGDVAAAPPLAPPSVAAPASVKSSASMDHGADGDASTSGGLGRGGGQQRNYKNMTRERRIEANARERTRVHTISAAFDTLRRAVPAYSNSQKLSKLSVLRIACSYILTLSRVAGMDYSADQSQPPVQECVDLVTRTIQTEGKLRRKRDD